MKVPASTLPLTTSYQGTQAGYGPLASMAISFRANDSSRFSVVCDIIALMLCRRGHFTRLLERISRHI